MNIFVLDSDPVIAAQNQCDKHVVKMILESAQMLCAIYPPGDAPYRRAFYNHPCTKWVRESADNYQWLLVHALALCDEYTSRYGKVHKSQDIIRWCGDNMGALNLPDIGLTAFAQAMPDECKNQDAVVAYRTYYKEHKARFAKWTNRDIPRWFKQAA